MDNLAGLTFGNYHLHEKIGDGGMAEVYLACHTTLDKWVAIKFIRPELSLDEAFRTRFEREARISARLSHPNIVRIADFGETQGRYYLVMDYIQGRTLKDYLQNLRAVGYKIRLEEIVSIVSQVGDALDYAHHAGIVHRDVKPDNILIASDDHVYLGDFGVARIIGLNGDQTASGIILGTPAYMSPEHIRSEGARISPASDIYALGVILYELITGKPPFTANTPILVMLKHLNAPVPDLASPLTDIPDGIEVVIRKTLAKDPAERYQKASVLIRDLQEVLEMTVRLSRFTPEPVIC
ncbi:MAG TPA: serine/threonine-protein kinase [Anaerolineales bacterium]|nr:serine/threonine-protein kinase [Anaerolineales bacterium]